MDSIKLISNNMFSGIHDLKTMCLYFDHIEVANHFRPYILGDPDAKPEKKDDGNYYLPGKLHIEEHFISNDYKNHLSTLINSGLVSLKYEPYMTEEVVDKSKKYLAVGDPSLNINSFLLMSYKDFFIEVKEEFGRDMNGNRTISFEGPLLPEASAIVKNLKGKDRDTDINFVFKYYGHLLSALLRNLDNGEKVITTSEILNNLLLGYYNSEYFQKVKKDINQAIEVEPAIAFNAVKMALPNVSLLSIEDTLELRHKLQDELEAFREYCKQLEFDLELNGTDPNYIRVKSKEFVENKIQPSLNDLKRSLQDINLNVPLKILEELKNPKSYSPLLLSINNNIANTYALLISMGLISFSVAMDYYKSRKKIKSDGLYYLLKLNKYN